MEDKQLHLHGHEYMSKLLKAESSARLLNVMQYVELEKNYTVADFACGNAPMLNFLGQKVKNYYGVDFSPSAINNAESRKSRLALQNAHFQCGSIKSFCNENYERFDAGFALDLSEHVCNEEWIQVLSSIKSSLKKSEFIYSYSQW